MFQNPRYIRIKIPKDVFRNLINIATKESFFMFNNKVYKQTDGVTMVSQLGLALPKIFVYNFEKWLKDCPHGLKPLFYRQYVDGILVLFYSFSHAEELKIYLCSRHFKTNFSLEKENDGRLYFLDINNFL